MTPLILKGEDEVVETVVWVQAAHTSSLCQGRFPSTASFWAAASLPCVFLLVYGGNGKHTVPEPLKPPGEVVPLVSTL